MSILVSQGINTLLFICRDHEVNVVDVYDNFLHYHNLELNFDFLYYAILDLLSQIRPYCKVLPMIMNIFPGS